MSRSRPSKLSPGSKLLLGIAAVALLGLGIFLGYALWKPPPPPDFSTLDPAGGDASSPPPSLPSPDMSPRTETPSPSVPELAEPAAPRSPRIALIIDDLGRSLDDVAALADLGVPITFSVLPYESKTPEVVADLRRRGVEMICHLPMEAKGGANPGPGALMLEMSRRELVAATHRALLAVEGAVGVNNHMGSAVSADREAITAVLEVLRAEELYYVDSRTSVDTLGYEVARQLGIPAAERQVFLDTEKDLAWIREQWARLLEVAASHGTAVAIAHPYPETIEILRQEIEAAKERGYEFVPASQLLNHG